MFLTDERQLYLQAVLDEQIDSNYVTVSELLALHHSLTDEAIVQRMNQEFERSDVTVFDHDWDYLNPH